MSGFNKRSRLAPQGSGKTPPAKGANDKPAPAPAAKAAPAVNKKLQWSIGDVLNKLDNPEEVIADAKAAIEVPAQGSQTPPIQSSAKPTTKQTSEKPVAKKAEISPPEKPTSPAKKASEDEQKPGDSAAKIPSDKVDSRKAEATNSRETQPDSWNEPTGTTAPVPSWEAKADPESAKAEYAWDIASGKTWQQDEKSDAAKSPELWGKSTDQPTAWSEQPSTPQWESKESADPDLWAKPDTDPTGWEFGSNYQAASPDNWAAGKTQEGADDQSAQAAEPGASGPEFKFEAPAESKVEPSESTAEPSELKVASSKSTAEPSELKAASSKSTAEPSELKADSSESTPEPIKSTAEPSELKADSSESTPEPSKSTVEPSELKADLSESRAASSELKAHSSESTTEPSELKADSSEDVSRQTEPVTGEASVSGSVAAALDEALDATSQSETAAKEPLEEFPLAQTLERTKDLAAPKETATEPVSPNITELSEAKLEADLDTATPPDSWNEPSTAQEALSQPEAKPEQPKATPVEEVEPWDNSVTTAAPDDWQEPAATAFDTSIGKEPAPNEEAKQEEPLDKKENKDQGGVAMRAAALLMKKAAAKKSEILHDDAAAKVQEPSRPGANTASVPEPTAASAALPIVEQPVAGHAGTSGPTTTDAVAESAAEPSSSATAPSAVPNQFGKSANVPSQFKKDVQTETSKISQKDLDKFAAATAKTPSKKEDTPKSTPVAKPAEPATPATASKATTTPPAVPADLLDQIGRKESSPPQPAAASSRAKETFHSLRSAPVPDTSIKAKLQAQTNRHQRTLVAATVALLVVVVGWFTWTFKERQDIGVRVEQEFANKQYADALVDVNKALVLYPNEARLHYMKGALLNMQGQAAQALPELMAADSQQPGNPEVIQERAKAYVALNKFPEAINDYNKIFSNKKNLKPEFLVGRGTAYAKSGQVEKGLQDFNQAVNLDPQNLTYRISRANALSALKKYTSAISDWNFVIKKQPQNSVAYAERGLAEYRAKNTTKALADIQTSLQKDGTATALFYRGIIRADQKQFAPAIADFSSALKYSPSNAVILAAKAQALAATGDFERALRDYNSLAGIQGAGGTDLDSTRARTAMAAGQYQQAADAYAKLIAKNPDDSKLRLNHALCCDKIGDYSKAYDDYSFLIGKEPTNADLYLKRGNLNVRQKRYKLANDDFQQAINLKNNNAEAYLARGLASASQGLYDQALVDVNHSLKLQPGNEIARAKSRELSRMRSSHNAPAPVASLPAPPRVSITGDPVSDGYKQMVAGDFSSAVQNFAAAIKKQPNNPLIRRYMAYSLVEGGQPAEAVEQFKALAALGALTPEDHTKYATALTNAGRQEDALEYLKKYIVQNPDNFSARMSLANLFLVKQQFMNAEEILKNGAQYAKSRSQVQQLQQMMETVRQKTQDVSPPVNDQPITRANSG